MNVEFYIIRLKNTENGGGGNRTENEKVGSQYNLKIRRRETFDMDTALSYVTSYNALLKSTR